MGILVKEYILFKKFKEVIVFGEGCGGWEGM